MQAVVDDLLHAGWIENGHHGVEEGEFALVRAGRAFAGVIVAHQGYDATVLGRAGMVGMPEGVAGAIDARTLAVPDAEDAVVLAFVAQLGLLRAPQRRRRQILVQTRLEDDVRGFREFGRGIQLSLKPGDRRAAIARHEARRIEASLGILGALHQHQPDDGLGAGQQHLGLIEIELVGQARLLGRLAVRYRFVIRDNVLHEVLTRSWRYLVEGG